MSDKPSLQPKLSHRQCPNEISTAHKLYNRILHCLETGSRLPALLLPVINHHVTQRPSSQQVRIERQDECSGPIQVRLGLVQQCDGELNGNYTWAGENQAENYVFFRLNGRANISRIRLTYAVVSSATQTPKVSFCAVLGDDRFNVSLSNLNCREIDIVSTASYMIQTSSLDMPFDRDTGDVTMEIITQGIKADFTATGVEVLGSNLPTGIRHVYTCS